MNEGSLIHTERKIDREREKHTGRVVFIFPIAFIIALNIITLMTVGYKLLVIPNQFNND